VPIESKSKGKVQNANGKTTGRTAGIHESGKLSAERMADLLDESNQLRAILSKSVATAKGKARKNEHD
jgi:hypothetical protein